MSPLVRNKLMKKLQKDLKIETRPSEDFDSNMRGGIWFYRDYSGYFNAEDTMDMDHPVNIPLDENGWFSEPYDSETIFAYKL